MRRPIVRNVSLPLAGVFLLSAAAAAQKTEKYPPPFPRYGAAKLKEYPFVTFWEVTREKGRRSPMYQLPLDQVTVTLTGGAVKYTTPDGNWRIEQERLGSVRFESKGTVIQEEGLSDVPSWAMTLEFPDVTPTRWPPSAMTFPGQFPRIDAIKLFENERFVVWDQTWVPGRPAANHTHYTDTASVYLAGGVVHSRLMGQPYAPLTPGDRKYAGQISVHAAEKPPGPPAAVHTEEGVEGATRCIWVELK